jgi:ArsR family transcriptional regulator, virulence genes transcriptional regulator
MTQEMKMDKKRQKLDSAVTLLKLLSHPVRLSILCNLLHNGEMSVTKIVDAEAGAAGQSQISQFLGKMRSDGLVRSRKEAQTVFYKIDSPQAKKVVQALYDIYCGKN